MRAVIQRVKTANVKVEGRVVGEIGPGLLVLLGVSKRDAEADADYLVKKILEMRIFEDAVGKMNRSLGEVNGELLIVSQFTLYGDCRKGRRPSYSEAAPPETANALYTYFVSEVQKVCRKVETGVFQAMMDVTLTNDGPVTLILESR